MRALILIVILILIGVLVGWITFHNEPGRATINVETQEIRDDTKGVVESGAKLLHKAGDELESNANREEPAPANR